MMDIASILAALVEVDLAHKLLGDYSGEVKCPKCGGALRWSKAKSNGHVHGACKTPGCLRWMQ